MAKETGLAQTTLSIDNDAGVLKDVKNDVTNWDFTTPFGVQETTGVDKSAIERLLLLADLSGTLNGVFNPTADRIHAVLSGNLRVVRTLTQVVSAKTFSNEVLFTSYGLTRAAGGELTVQAPFVLADGTVPVWT